MATVASLASFVLNRINVAVDQLLGHRIVWSSSTSCDRGRREFLGKVVIANAELA